jgi:hypothetical protein
MLPKLYLARLIVILLSDVVSPLPPTCVQHAGCGMASNRIGSTHSVHATRRHTGFI